jgi:hypothetical protein
MAKLKEMVTFEREYHVCDICGERPMSCNLHRCKVCGCEVCISCGTCDRDDGYSYLCHDCKSVGEPFAEEEKAEDARHMAVYRDIMVRWKKRVDEL